MLSTSVRVGQAESAETVASVVEAGMPAIRALSGGKLMARLVRGGVLARCRPKVDLSVSPKEESRLSRRGAVDRGMAMAPSLESPCQGFQGKGTGW